MDNQLGPPAEVVRCLSAAGIKNDVAVCVYDEGGGYLAARVWWVLDYLSHSQLSLLDGGLSAWIAAGGTLSSADVAVATGRFVQKRDPKRRMEYSDVVAGMSDARTVLCNTLSPGAFLVESIPGSINIPYTDTIDSEHFPRLKSRHELKLLFAGHGITNRNRLVCYWPDRVHCISSLLCGSARWLWRRGPLRWKHGGLEVSRRRSQPGPLGFVREVDQ